jgi:hypothetical protein
MAGLRKDAGPDAYFVTGTLAGIKGPGRRTVRELTVGGLKGNVDGDLAVLSAFPDLESLTLENIADIDLAPLAQTGICGLGLIGVSRVDLAALAKLDQLQGLMIADIADCIVPPVLRLATSLEALTIFNDGARLSGEPVAELARRIDWSALRGLRTLQLSVGGNHDLAPVGVDLSFLRELPELRVLRMEQGIFHDGPEPSPLEPPFAGLSRNLTWVRIDAVDPEPLRLALEEVMARPAPTDSGPYGVTVYGRPPPGQRSSRGEWAIHAYDDGGWGVYGSLYATLDSEDETEYEAADRAQQRLRSADAELAKRLDFDPESNGTGIYAESREDLETALRLLGLID